MIMKGYLSLSLHIAVPAVNRSVSLWFKRHFTLCSALGAGCFVHLSFTEAAAEISHSTFPPIHFYLFYIVPKNKS